MDSFSFFSFSLLPRHFYDFNSWILLSRFNKRVPLLLDFRDVLGRSSPFGRNAVRMGYEEVWVFEAEIISLEKKKNLRKTRYNYIIY